MKTPINVNKLEYELNNFPDIECKNYLLSGLRSGFHTGIRMFPTNSIECKNLRSAVANPQCVSELVQCEVNKGYLYGPFF